MTSTGSLHPTESLFDVVWLSAKLPCRRGTSNVLSALVDVGVPRRCWAHSVPGQVVLVHRLGRSLWSSVGAESGVPMSRTSSGETDSWLADSYGVRNQNTSIAWFLCTVIGATSAREPRETCCLRNLA